MKFDFVIGNPPYNEDFDNSGDNGNFAKPVYNCFIDEAYKIADKVELIHPARFLFNAESMFSDLFFGHLFISAGKIFSDRNSI